MSTATELFMDADELLWEPDLTLCPNLGCSFKICLIPWEAARYNRKKKKKGIGFRLRFIIPEHLESVGYVPGSEWIALMDYFNF